MPERVVIVNTSPLLYLHRAASLSLLESLYGEVLVPPAVNDELRHGAGGAGDKSIPDVSSIPWIHVRAVSHPSLIPAVVDLGRGEAEVIALAIELNADLVILDDQLARRIAVVNRLTLTGTIGVLLRAKAKGLVESVLERLRAMRDSGMWVSDDLLEIVANLAGEAHR